jgi:hypothetical protein|tara:strand:+ start:397 stop:636 length:240 start_codon:yes stop_codon:yes gene_type:complete
MNDIIENRKLIQEIKDVLAQYLKVCNEERTPYVCNLKSTPQGYKEVEDFVLKVVVRGGNKVGFAIMELERQLNPNYIIE